MRAATDNERHWSTKVKALHWCIALAVLLEVPAGYVMSQTYGPSFKDPRALDLHILASQIHHTLGYVILAAALVWVLQRLRHKRAAWDEAVTPVQRVLARFVHVALIVLLITVPWSGWTALSALADSAQFGVTHRWFFGTDGLIPRIWTPLPFNDPAGYSRFARLHVWGLWAGLALLTVHLAAALWHHFIRRDGVLRRMWPLGVAPDSSPGN